MKNFKSILAAIVTIGAVLPVSAASVDYGYCADEPAQYGASALSTTNYAVIQIPAEIAAKYAGASITGVKLLCQTYTLNDVPVNTVNAFVVEDFDNFAPVISKEATVEGKVWDSVKFDESYTITGDKDIYVGYSMKANALLKLCLLLLMPVPQFLMAILPATAIIEVSIFGNMPATLTMAMYLLGQ